MNDHNPIYGINPNPSASNDTFDFAMPDIPEPPQSEKPEPKDKDAVGFKSDSEISISFSDWSKSNFAILISGLFCFDRLIASFKVFGILTIALEFFLSLFGSAIFPIIFS